MKIAEIRKQFPIYNDLSDGELARGIHKKYYPEMPYADFLRRIDFSERVDPTEGMSGLEKFEAARGKAAVDLGRGVGQRLGLVDQESIDAAKALDEPLMQTGAGQAGNVLGNVTLAAGGLAIPGANTVLGGAALGGALGAMSPVASGESLLGRVAEGAAFGGGGNLAAKAVGLGMQAAKPLTSRGQQEVIGNLLRNATGDNAQAVEQRLANARALVPGSEPTAAQVAESGGIATLERAARSSSPEMAEQYAARDLAQSGARRAAVRDIAGTEADRTFAEQARAAVATPLYEAAAKSGVVPDKVLMELAKRPAMQKAMREAETLLRERGKYGAFNAAEFMQAMKFSLDSAVNTAPQKGIEGASLNAIKATRAEFNGWLEKNIPKFARANRVYESMSGPVNKMDVGHELYERLVPALSEAGVGGRETANAFANALRGGDALAQRVTGQQGATLAKTLTPEQLQTLEAVKQDLARKAAGQDLGRAVGSNSFQNISTGHLLERSGVPTWMRNLSALQIPGNLAARLGKTVYADADRQMQEALAQALLNPKQAAELMRMLPTQRSQALANALRGASTALPIGVVQSQ